MNETTYQQVQALSRMTVGELRERYIDVFGEETRSYHKDFLRKRIAWRIQAMAEGDLSERAKRRAEEIANDADLRVRTPRDPVKPGLMEVRERSVTGRLHQLRDRRLPLPGTLLAREFRGRDIVVKVLDKGFEYDGRRFKSLSAIAQEATGSKWNGFLFFGLAESKEPRKHNGVILPTFDGHSDKRVQYQSEVGHEERVEAGKTNPDQISRGVQERGAEARGTRGRPDGSKAAGRVGSTFVLLAQQDAAS